MAIEKMVLFNLVGSLEEEHALLEQLVTGENIHLNHQHDDLHDNNYIVHQYEAMMPHDTLPRLENYTQLQAECQSLEHTVLGISKGMSIKPQIKKNLLQKSYTIEHAKRDLLALEEEVGSGIQEITQKRKRIEELQAFKKKAICIEKNNFNLNRLSHLKFFTYQLGLLSKENNMQIKKNYENITAVVFRIGTMNTCQEDIYLIIYPRQFEEETVRLLKSLNWVELNIPEEVADTSEQLVRTIDDQISQYEAAIREIEKVILKDRQSNALLLSTIFTRIKMEQKIIELKQEIVHGNNVFMLNAWVKSKDKEKLEERLGNITDKFVILFKNTDELDKKVMPPTHLRNNWLFRPFEAIVRLYGLPSYYEIDPTPFLALTFILMFGIMFGDIGQGFVYFLAGVILSKKNISAGSILSRLGLSSIVFGCVYGSFFGLEQHHMPWLPSLTGPVLSPDNIMPVLIVGIVFGIVVLSVSFMIGIINAFRRNDLEEAVFGKNSITGYIFFVSFIITILCIVGLVPLSVGIPLGIMGVALVIMILKEPLTNIVLKKKPYIHGSVGEYFTESIFEGIETILGAFSNTMSFIRIGAFALNHAGLFMAFLVMAGEVNNIVAQVLVLLIGNLLILSLEGLVVFIQSLRLQYYEMFSKYFHGDGIDYIPIKID